MGDNCVVWCLSGAPGSGTNINPGILELIPYGRRPCSVLIQRGEACSCLSLICQALLIPYGRNYTLQVVDGGCKELGRRGRQGKCGWYKIEFKKIKKNKDKIWMCRKVGLMLEEKQTG